MKLAVCALLALLALPAAGLEPYLVKDIEPASTPAGSHPLQLVTFRGAVLFFADDGIAGRALWRTDGTATVRLSEENFFPTAMPFFLTERLYFFLSQHPINGEASLWVSDGTPAGTFRLTEEGVTVSSFHRLWSSGQGFFYFTARDPEHGEELWRTDGTPAGTHLVDDVRPGPEGSDIQGLAELRGRIWFGADDGVHGGSLWSTDGTPAGTALAIDPVPSSSNHGSLEHLQVVRNRLVFFAPPPGRGRGLQLWAGDGTVKGTFPVTSLPPGTVLVQAPVTHANRIYFLVQRKLQQLWVSDGTPRGTRMLTSAPSSRLTIDLSSSRGLGNRLVFRAMDRAHGFEPWVTNGTAAGTRLLRDVCPGECSGNVAPQKVSGGRLYFIASPSFTGNELWVTDGTTEGTRRVKDGLAWAYAFFEVGNRLLFVNSDDEHGWEIWRTDGTAAGTVRVTDFAPRFLWEDVDFYGTVLNGQLFFNADDGEHGYEIWRTNGTAAGTALVADVNHIDAGGSFPRSFMRLGSLPFFFTGTSAEPVLWKSDGTAAGTVPVKAFGPEELGGTRTRLGLFAEAGGVLVYYSDEASGGRYAAWRTDGTEAGTFALTGLSAVPGSLEMESVGSTVFFLFQDEEHGAELWATDGTVAGTRLVEDILPGQEGSRPLALTAFQGKVYFVADVPGQGQELWVSDGTAAGTHSVADVDPGPTGSIPSRLTVHAGRLWFFTQVGNQLWSTDGTEAGTRLEVEFSFEPYTAPPMYMASLGGRLLISFAGQGLWVTDGTPAGTRQISGRPVDAFGLPTLVFQGRFYYTANATLHVTDGTEAGTRQLLDRDGHPVFGPGPFQVLGNRFVFAARRPQGDLVLWESDGTPAGTHPVEPPALLNSAWDLIRAGDRIFFAGFEPLTGWELWAVRP